MPSFDFIETFVRETAASRSPEPFRLWAAIFSVAAALERRVWTSTTRGLCYPNLYVALCGDPGSGKSLMINQSRDILAPVSGLHLGPDAPTPASFTHALERASRTSINGIGAIIYVAVTALIREAGVFFPKYDDAFFAALSDIWDNPPIYDMPRAVSKSVKLERPTINLMFGATPSKLGSLFPDAAWGEGFTSRVMFIYGSETGATFDEIFGVPPSGNASVKDLSARLSDAFANIHGPFSWEPDAVSAMQYWANNEKEAPVPTHTRLVFYNVRRRQQLIKLSMISAVSAGHPSVELSDFQRAQHWLFSAERTMPDVFRAIGAKSDKVLIDEAHYAMYAKYATVAREKRVPLHERELYEFLGERAQSERVPRIIEQMLRSGVISRRGCMPDEFVPRPLNEHSKVI